jgi:8-hydroxy-5-deazaflavin:NADPH oxidoreductase
LSAIAIATERIMTARDIGIIGAGHAGAALAAGWAAKGLKVKVANSRGAQSLQEFSSRTGATAVDLPEITAGVAVLVLAVPEGKAAALRPVVDSLAPAAVVVDAGNYYPLRDGPIEDIIRGMPESEWVVRQIGRPVIKAFNSIIAGRILTQGRDPGQAGRVALPVSGDDPAAKAVVMDLVELLGFDAWDAGTLQDSWRQQPGQGAYCTDQPLESLKRLLAQADPVKGPQQRDQDMAALLPILATASADDLVRMARASRGLAA